MVWLHWAAGTGSTHSSSDRDDDVQDIPLPLEDVSGHDSPLSQAVPGQASEPVQERQASASSMESEHTSGSGADNAEPAVDGPAGQATTADPWSDMWDAGQGGGAEVSPVAVGQAVAWTKKRKVHF